MLKHYSISLFLVLICNTSVAQSCEIYNSKTINCRDKDSLKQGFWFEYKVQKNLTTDSLKRNPRAIGFHNDEGLIHTPIAEGNYKDNKRVGQWIYYVGSFYNDTYLYPTSHLKSVTFTDKGYFYEVDTFWNYTATISNDTNHLTGRIILNTDTIKVNCKNKKCLLYNPYNRKREKFNYRKLEVVIYRLNVHALRSKQKKVIQAT